ncbi:MAG: DUF1778 domain-containing protein [Pseudomonadota bacterium]
MTDKSKIVLTNEQFDRFMKVCEATPTPDSKIQEAARKLDEEGF